MVFTDKRFLKFLLVFGAVFCACYFGALLLTGLATPGGRYSPFVENYLNISACMRDSLIHATKALVGLFGTETIRVDAYELRIPDGPGIRIVYSCLGFGVMSFWAAYIIASAGKLKKMIVWLCGGLLLLWMINVTRLALVLETAKAGKSFLFGWDHHTWFNIIAYIFILLLIFLHERFTPKLNNE